MTASLHIAFGSTEKIGVTVCRQHDRCQTLARGPHPASCMSSLWDDIMTLHMHITDVTNPRPAIFIYSKSAYSVDVAVITELTPTPHRSVTIENPVHMQPQYPQQYFTYT